MENNFELKFSGNDYSTLHGNKKHSHKAGMLYLNSKPQHVVEVTRLSLRWHRTMGIKCTEARMKCSGNNLGKFKL